LLQHDTPPEHPPPGPPSLGLVLGFDGLLGKRKPEPKQRRAPSERLVHGMR